MTVAALRSTTVLFRRHWDRAAAAMTIFWSWWSAEIYDVLPAILRETIDRWRQCLFLAVDGQDLRLYVGSWQKMREVAKNSREPGTAPGCELPVDVRDTILLVPLDRVITRQVSLPASAEGNLRERLARELDQWTPSGEADVYFDYRVIGRDIEREELHVELVYSPRREIDRYMTAVLERGIDVNVITTRGLYSPEAKIANLLPPGMRPTRPPGALRVSPVHALATGLLLAIAIAVPVMQKNSAIAEVAERARVTEEQAAEGDRLRRGLERMAATSRFLVEKKESSVMAVQLIDEVSRILPDDTWISNLEISETRLRLEGESGASASLIGIIDASPLFERAQFKSPVVHVAGRDADRFVLSADVVRAIER